MAGKWREPGNPGLKIRVLRVVRQMNQLELSRRSGVAQSRISVLENGYANPSLRERRFLSAALGCDENELFKEGGEL